SSRCTLRAAANTDSSITLLPDAIRRDTSVIVPSRATRTCTVATSFLSNDEPGWSHASYITSCTCSKYFQFGEPCPTPPTTPSGDPVGEPIRPLPEPPPAFLPSP